MPPPRTLVRVPDLVGMDSVYAAGLLREVGLRAWVVRLKLSEDFDRGIVTGQEPSAGAMVERRHRIVMDVSSGRR
jgi:beta-lactam-binding protein with PASTA domain